MIYKIARTGRAGALMSIQQAASALRFAGCYAGCYLGAVGLLALGSVCFGQGITALTVAPVPAVRAKISTTVDTKLQLQILQGYHVQSNTPSDPYLIALKLTWNPGPLESAGVAYPKPKMEKYSFSDKPLSVFSGNFEVSSKFKVSADAIAGPTAMTGKLRYQACNDSMCLPPKTVDVKLQVDIVR